MERKKVPKSIEAEVIFKSDRKCCVCKEKGHHIHHIDVRDDNTFNNLAFLCFNCHDEASKTSSLSKKLSKETIIKYRDHHYSVIEVEREKSLKILDQSIGNLSEEKLLTASKNAIIIIEIEKIKNEYFETDWNGKSAVLNKIDVYQNQIDRRITFEILDFLEMESCNTRSGMTLDVADKFWVLILTYLPNYRKEIHDEWIELALKCIAIADAMIYDSTTYLKNLQVTRYGLLILKLIYRMSKEREVITTLSKVEKCYRVQLSNTERTDVGDMKFARELLLLFQKNLDEFSYTFPKMSDELSRAVY